jgi:hypothetical protein
VAAAFFLDHHCGENLYPGTPENEKNDESIGLIPRPDGFKGGIEEALYSTR